MIFLSSLSGSPVYGAMLAHQEFFGRFFCGLKQAHQQAADWDKWALDNGAFKGFNKDIFLRALEKMIIYRHSCKFVVVPDVPFHWDATLEKYYSWHMMIANLGFPRAIAIQNGATQINIPWGDCDAIFIGGDTQWKRSIKRIHGELFKPQTIEDSPVLDIIHEAKRRDKWVHFGRQANSRQQLINAFYWKADSVDGTRETYAPNREFKWIAQTLWELHNIDLLRNRWNI